MGLLNLGMSLFLVRPYGILGVAYGTAIPNVLFAAALLFLACRELGVSLSSYFGYVAVRALAGALLPLGLLLGWKHGFHPAGLGALVAAGIASVLFFAVVWVTFVYRDDPYLDLRAQIAPILPAAWRRKRP
jgi:hypothetical protein